tara:strand:- start:12 stop:623 length:612 start_codon:yes stop_codon:yes gene_type:complete
MNQKIALKQLNFMKKNSSKMRLAAEKWRSEWQILISTILSARTRDEKTIPVSEELFEKYSTIKKLSNSKIREIEKIIRPVNFYRNKSKNIINCSKEIVKNYNGKVPNKIEELIKLPGVGRKTANVFLSEIGGSGIGVDTHVSYISQKLGWTKNKKPEKIEEDLKKLFSKKHWNKVNSTLVRFGKTHTSRKKKDELLEEINKIK